MKNRILLAFSILLFTGNVFAQMQRTVIDHNLNDVDISSIGMTIYVSSDYYYNGTVTVSNSFGQTLASVQYTGYSTTIPIVGDDGSYIVILTVNEDQKSETLYLHNDITFLYDIENDNIIIMYYGLNSGAVNVINSDNETVDIITLSNDTTIIPVTWSSDYYTLNININGTVYTENIYISQPEPLLINVFYRDGFVVISSDVSEIESIAITSAENHLVAGRNNTEGVVQIPADWDEGNYNVTVVIDGREYNSIVYVPEINQQTAINKTLNTEFNAYCISRTLSVKVSKLPSNIEIYTLSGVKIHSQRLLNFNTPIDLSQYSDGYYLIKMYNSKKQKIEKIFVE